MFFLRYLVYQENFHANGNQAIQIRITYAFLMEEFLDLLSTAESTLSTTCTVGFFKGLKSMNNINHELNTKCILLRTMQKIKRCYFESNYPISFSSL